jgi:hypothetical protein
MHYYVSAGFLSKHEYSAGEQGGLFISQASLASHGSPLASTVRNGLINQPLEEVWVEFTRILIHSSLLQPLEDARGKEKIADLLNQPSMHHFIGFKPPRPKGLTASG